MLDFYFLCLFILNIHIHIWPHLSGKKKVCGVVNFGAGPRSPFSHMNLSWFNTLMALVVRPTSLQVCLGRGQHNSMPTIIVVVLTGIGSTWKILAFFWAPYQGYVARVGSCDGIHGQPSPKDKALPWPKPGMARAMCSLPFPNVLDKWKYKRRSFQIFDHESWFTQLSFLF